MCSRYGKGVRSISRLKKYVNVSKISNSLPYNQLLNLELVLNYNTVNFFNLSFNNYKENISLKNQTIARKKLDQRVETTIKKILNQQI